MGEGRLSQWEPDNFKTAFGDYETGRYLSPFRYIPLWDCCSVLIRKVFLLGESLFCLFYQNFNSIESIVTSEDVPFIKDLIFANKSGLIRANEKSGKDVTTI